MLSGCKAEPLRVSQSECTPLDLLCITRPRCAGDIMTYKRKRVEKFHPSISTGREQTAVPFEQERGFKKTCGGCKRERKEAINTPLTGVVFLLCRHHAGALDFSGMDLDWIMAVDHGLISLCPFFFNIIISVIRLPGHIQQFRVLFLCSLLLTPSFSFHLITHPVNR